MILAPLVRLYRHAGCPRLDSGTFSCQLGFAEGAELVREVISSGVGRFTEILVDDVDFDEAEPLPKKGSRIEFTFKVISSGNSTFHENIQFLLSSGSNISVGDPPQEFYLVAEDYYTGDVSVPDRVKALGVVSGFIKALRSLARYEDSKQGLRLVFVPPPDNRAAPPVVIEVRITPELLDAAKDLNTEIVEQLAGTQAHADPHHSARLGVFEVTMTEFVAGREPNVEPFYHLVQQWSKFTTAYQNSLAVYLSGFAFHKAKREVAEAELEIAGQYAKITSEIMSKLFSLPISLAGIVVIIEASNALYGAVPVLGLLLVGVIMHGAINNQLRQLKHVSHAKGVVLGALEGRRDTYPPDLNTALREMKESLSGADDRLAAWLWAFKCMSWAPLILALLCYWLVHVV